MHCIVGKYQYGGSGYYSIKKCEVGLGDPANGKMPRPKRTRVSTFRAV